MYAFFNKKEKYQFLTSQIISTTQNFIVENYTLIYYFDYKIIFLIKKSIIKYIFSYKSHVKIIKHSHSSLGCSKMYLNNKTRMDLME